MSSNCIEPSGKVVLQNDVDDQKCESDGKNKKQMSMSFVYILNDYIFQSKYWMRLAAVASVLCSICYSISNWINNEKNRDVVNEQYYICMSVIAFFASHFVYDFFKRCTEEMANKRGNLDIEDIDKICQFRPWDFFSVF